MTDNSKQSNTQALLFELAESLSSLVIREHQILQAELNQVGSLVEDAVKELGGSFRGLNACVTEHAVFSNETDVDDNHSGLIDMSEQINVYTSNMKRVLQFDDIVQQLAGHASDRIGHMKELFAVLDKDVAKLKSVDFEQNSESLNQLAQMLEDIGKYRQMLEKENPVKQGSMDAGEIELF